MQHIKNPETEKLAQKIADHVKAENWEKANDLWTETTESMVRWEIMVFRDRIQFLAREDDPCH